MTPRMIQAVQKLKRSKASGTPPELVSFDVFETLLVRPVATPDDVNALVARRLRDKGACNLSDEAYSLLRSEAEKRAMERNATTRESQTTLDEIAEELSRATNLPLTITKGFLDEELQLEGDLLSAMPGASRLVDDFRSQGAEIVYISDMYLPSEKVFEWLLREGIARPGERIYVSGEVGVSKGTGNLFLHVLSDAGYRPSQMLHLGNNRHADLAGAERAKVRARLLGDGNLTRYEKNLASVNGGWGGILAGTSRKVRLQRGAAQNSFEAAAAGVVAPIIVSYVVWLLYRARERGVDRLLFLSRDGLLPYKIACELAPRMGIEIPMSYLYASRRTWGLAALSRRTDESMAWVIEPSSFLSVRSCLARAGLTPEQAEGILSETGFPAVTWDTNLTDDQRPKLAQLLLSNESLGRLLEERRQEELGLVRDYFEQEHVLESNVIGLCDLGWHGTLQQALRDLLDGPCDRPDIEIEGYYVGINRSARFFPSEKNIARGFLKDAHHGPRQVGKWHLRMGFFLETFCAADHGTLVGYARRGAEVVPVLDSRFDKIRGAELRDILLQTTLDFARLVPLDSYRQEALEQVPLTILKNVELFWLRPTRDEAKVWGRFPTDDRTGGDGGTDPGLASPFSLDTVVDILKNGSDKDRVAWFAGALAQTDPLTAKAVSAALRLDELTRTFRNSD